jgi:uncharacterized protein YcaQ
VTSSGIRPARTISIGTARRAAIAAQRLSGHPPTGDAQERLLETVRAIRCLQLDPIAAVTKTHLLVLWSRVGAFDPSDLDLLLWRDRTLFEYWAHAASIVLTEDYQLHQGRMRTFPVGKTVRSRRTKDWLRANGSLRRRILVELRRNGPLPARAFDGHAASERWASSGWTSGHDVTQMLDVLMTQGRIMVAGRDGQGRLWDLAERCLPDWTPRRNLTQRQINLRAVELAVRALGVASTRDVSRHFLRNWYDDLPGVLRELEERGSVTRVALAAEGGEPAVRAFVHTDDLPIFDWLERDDGFEPRTTLLSPFDNLICDRARTRRLWAFDYTIEIYVPREKRRYGYYVMPILHGDRLVGRVDPLMDRTSGRLTIKAVHAEPGAPDDRATGEQIAGALADLATFLGATQIAVRNVEPEGWRPALDQL